MNMGQMSKIVRWLFCAVLAFGVTAAQAAPALKWPKGKQAAIVLTYDDGLKSHLDVAIPQLDAARIKGTFFLNGSEMTPAEMVRWRAADKAGHELGNHSLFHPCPRTMLPNRERYATETYDVDGMIREISAMNSLLFGIDGRRVHTYAYPCSQSFVGGTDYVPAMRKSGLVKYARTGGDPYNSVVVNFADLDIYNVPSNGPVDSPSGATLIEYVERVRAAGGMGVLQFHGVGGDYLEVSAKAHQALVTYLKSHPEVWVVTFQEAMDYVVAKR